MRCDYHNGKEFLHALSKDIPIYLLDHQNIESNYQ